MSGELSPPVGKRCLVVEVAYFGVTIIGHTETFVRVDAVVRRAKVKFFLVKYPVGTIHILIVISDDPTVINMK